MAEPQSAPALGTPALGTLAPGTRVRTVSVDPVEHVRLPRYARGKPGVVLEYEGRHPLPSAKAAGRTDAPAEPVYAVQFAAADLWGGGDHTVTIDLWESYLEVGS